MADNNEGAPEQPKPETKPDTHINLKVKAQVPGSANAVYSFAPHVSN